MKNLQLSIEKKILSQVCGRFFVDVFASILPDTMVLNVKCFFLIIPPEIYSD